MTAEISLVVEYLWTLLAPVDELLVVGVCRHVSTEVLPRREYQLTFSTLMQLEKHTIIEINGTN